MIQIQPLVYNAFQVNSFLIWDDQCLEALVVDPAFYSPEEQRDFEAALKEKKLKLTGQINTHGHVDHVLGVNYVKQEHGFPFQAHREEEKLVANAPLTGDLFGWSVEPIEGIDQYLKEGQEIKVGEESLRALWVPGHSPGSLAFYSKTGAFVITGDALFNGSIGRTDLPGGDYDVLIASIRENLLTLPPETTVYPGHGPSTSIKKEKESNPYLG